MTDNLELDDTLTMVLRSVIQTLSYIMTEDLENHCNKAERQIMRADSMGAILDPTGYRDALQSGQIEDARYQLRMAQHLLAARKVLDERERFVSKRHPQQETDEWATS